MRGRTFQTLWECLNVPSMDFDLRTLFGSAPKGWLKKLPLRPIGPSYSSPILAFLLDKLLRFLKNGNVKLIEMKK